MCMKKFSFSLQQNFLEEFSMLFFQGCQNKLLEIQWLRTIEVYCLVVAKSLKSRCWQSHAFSKDYRRSLLVSWLLVAATIPWHYRCIIPIFAFVILWQSPCGSVSLSFNGLLIMTLETWYTKSVHLGKVPQPGLCPLGVRELSGDIRLTA